MITFLIKFVKIMLTNLLILINFIDHQDDDIGRDYVVRLLWFVMEEHVSKGDSNAVRK